MAVNAKTSRARDLRLFRFFLRKEARANGWPESEIKKLFGGVFTRMRTTYVPPGP
jgi:hypothetical protein